MPLPNEHSCRVFDPMSSETSVTKRKTIAPGVSIIIQKRKSDPDASMKTQAYRFSKHQFTEDEARSWLKKHNISCRFEPAKKEETRQDLIDRITKELSGAIIK